MKTTYKMTESQFNALISKKSNKNIDEQSSGDDTYRNTLKSSDIDFYIDIEEFWPDFDRNKYNFEYYVSQATVEYSIDIEYRSNGIKSINLYPKMISLSGNFNIDNGEIDFYDNFELSFTNDGLVENTLSGQYETKFGVFNVPEISKDVSFEFGDRLDASSTSFIIYEAEINIGKLNKITFYY